MKHIAIAILLFTAFVACTQQGQSPATSEHDILGTWLNESLHVTYLGRDSVFKVPAGQWEAVLKIKPIETTYKSDHTYSSNYFALNDSLMFTNKGTWALEGDSLALTTEGVTTKYLFTFKDGVGTFEGMLDWDQDGAANELYKGTQIKQ